MKKPVEAATAEVRFEYSAEGSHRGTHEHSCLEECARIVGRASLDPGKAVVVVTGDFVRSVRDRFPAEIRHHYNSERGDGEVGAKTMVVADEVQVIMHEYYFEPQPDPSFDYALRNKMIARLIRHEAGHVTMEHAGEANGPTIDRDGDARRRFLHIADEVISEYRAELGVALDDRTHVDGFEPEELAAWLRNRLAQVTTVDYQAHLDPRRLAYDVAGALQLAAKQLAPIAAKRVLQGIAPGAAFNAATEADPDWRAMGQPVWVSFAQALDGIPPASERIPQADLDRATVQLADVLHDWLIRLDFNWDDAMGSFHITSFQLYT